MSRSVLEELEKSQDELVVEDDLTPYAGQWVAIRYGHVVAHDVDPAHLRENPDVEPNDVILAVGNPAGGYYFL